jgi:hypothetical protein
MPELSAAAFGAAVFFYVEEDGLVGLSGGRVGAEACEEGVDGGVVAAAREAEAVAACGFAAVEEELNQLAQLVGVRGVGDLGEEVTPDHFGDEARRIVAAVAVVVEDVAVEV